MRFENYHEHINTAKFSFQTVRHSYRGSLLKLLLMPPSHYEFLGLKPDSTPQAIKNAYLEMIKTFHPDRNPGCGLSAAMSVYANAAYEILGDPLKRVAYDEVLIHRFANYLCEQNIIQAFQTEMQTFHRLSGPLRFELPVEKISELKRAYLPDIEKGGLFLFQPVWENGILILRLEEIVFLPNVSMEPEIEFTYNEVDYMHAVKRALHYKLLPCFFHSHPTAGTDFIDEHSQFIYQMETSFADKIATQQAILAGVCNLRLPEFLVIADGNTKSGLFIGVYGGLVAPLDFKERKKTLTDDLHSMIAEDAREFTSTTTGKVIAVAAGIGVTWWAFSNRKHVLPAMKLIKSVTEQVAYTSAGPNLFFGISHGDGLSIDIPSVKDSVILEDERKIITRRSDFRMTGKSF